MDRIIYQSFSWGMNESWKSITDKLNELKEVGFTTIYLPPPYQGLKENSRGYDVHDHFSLESNWGSKKELLKLINKAHNLNLEVITDLILFRQPLYTNSNVNYDELSIKERYRKQVKWLTDIIAFDGFRLDDMKRADKNLVKDLLQNELKNKFVFMEYWTGNAWDINNKVDEFGCYALDFGTFYELKKLCCNPYYNYNNLSENSFEKINPFRTVTFAENHDTDRWSPIIKNKITAYAYILFHGGYPIIFSKDYYQYGLKKEIDKLLDIRKKLDGGIEVLEISKNLYKAKRGNYILEIKEREWDIWEKK